jgi:RNA polymerase sigma factor (sigma-70 family)
MSESLPREEELSEGELPTVVERMRPKLHALFYRFRLSPEDAEDVLQSALVQALVRWPEIRNKDGWLYGTVFRMCRGSRRSAWKRDVVPMDPQDLEWVGAATAPPQERVECLADVERACRSLSRRQGRVLMLRHGHGLRAAEVAAEVGVQPSSVRKMARRAMAQVRAALLADEAAGVMGALRARRSRGPGIGGPASPGAASPSAAAPTEAEAWQQMNPAAVFVVLLPVLTQLSGRAKRVLRFELEAPRYPPGPPGPPGRPGRPSPAAAVESWPLARDITWDAATEAFLARYGDRTRSCYRRELARAGSALGRPPLAGLTREALLAWRALLVADGRRPAAHAYGLSVLRSFLGWTGEQGAHELPREVLREALAPSRQGGQR